MSAHSFQVLEGSNLDSKKYGVKVSVISTLDYDDFRELLDAIAAKGYKVIMSDNGNAVCTKEASR